MAVKCAVRPSGKIHAVAQLAARNSALQPADPSVRLPARRLISASTHGVWYSVEAVFTQAAPKPGGVLAGRFFSLIVLLLTGRL